MLVYYISQKEGERKAGVLESGEWRGYSISKRICTRMLGQITRWNGMQSSPLSLLTTPWLGTSAPATAKLLSEFVLSPFPFLITIIFISHSIFLSIQYYQRNVFTLFSSSCDLILLFPRKNSGSGSLSIC